MNTKAINPSLLPRLKDKRYRDLFIASQINKLIPYQIRALRAARNNMTQEELAERAETTQSVISRIQNRGASNLNIKSLLKLASAFDVALVVRFEPIDKFIDWVDDLSPEVMSPEPSELILSESEREALSPKQDEPVTESTPAAVSRVLLDAEHLFPSLPATSTTGTITYLPGMHPVGVSMLAREEVEAKQVTASTTAATETVPGGQTRTLMAAGGRL